LAVVGFGLVRWKDKLEPGRPAGQPTARATQDGKRSGSEVPQEVPEIELAATQFEVPKLAPAGAYAPKDGIIDVELSEYAGYAGLIAANGGLEPSENSIFFRKHGFKVRIKLSEEESWSALNSGKMAASATTADVLAVYGRQFQVVVPVQIGFSRGADGVVVRSGIKRINDLKGKVLAASQFTEADFFIRYLAQEAGLAVNMLPDLKTPAEREKLNLVYCEDAFVAGDAFLSDVQSGANRLAGCVTWAPKTTEVAEASKGKAHILTTNKNLLIIADILVVNKGFAQQQPKMVEGLVEGLLEGNKLVRDNSGPARDAVSKAFQWERAQTQLELAKVHLSNGLENLAFFSGAIDAAGSFGGIYQSAIYAYGGELIKDPLDSERFVDLQHLRKLEQSGAFAGQQVAIQPIRTQTAGPVESDPLLSKNIRFLFQPNKAELDLDNEGNRQNLADLKQLLQVSPGSTILLRGHVDNAQIETFRKQGGEAFLRQQAMRAVEFSKQRASEIKRLLVELEKVDPARLETVGRGWEEPVGSNMDQNRRVEAQWFTLE
ncbi:MAG: phosphate ABC transporter substrate-binding/OmpA family protein, partial [Verrucomicrobiota bacterium]|nr:phosphate ABC transporter substrate-binding/OmpA family protein [Verrucomicrobiota bacterium]